MSDETNNNIDAEDNFMPEIFDDDNQNDIENGGEDNLSSEGNSPPGRMTPSSDSDEGEVLPHPQYPPINNEVFDKLVDKIEFEINNSMTSCNDIDRAVNKIVKDSSVLDSNIDELIAKRGEVAIIYHLMNLISKFTATIIVSQAHTKTIRFSQGRAQMLIDDVKELVKK